MFIASKSLPAVIRLRQAIRPGRFTVKIPTESRSFIDRKDVLYWVDAILPNGDFLLNLMNLPISRNTTNPYAYIGPVSRGCGILEIDLQTKVPIEGIDLHLHVWKGDFDFGVSVDAIEIIQEAESLGEVPAGGGSRVASPLKDPTGAAVVAAKRMGGGRVDAPAKVGDVLSERHLSVVPGRRYELVFTVLGEPHVLDAGLNEKAFLATISGLGDDGGRIPLSIKGLSKSDKYGNFLYLSEVGRRWSFLAPPTLSALVVQVHPWASQAKDARFSIELETVSLSEADVLASVAIGIDEILARADLAKEILVIYTGTKRIGKDGRANRSMMFAHEAQMMGIPTLYVYQKSDGELDFTRTTDDLMQVPNNLFDRFAGSVLPIGTRGVKATLIGSLPDTMLCSMIGTAKEYGWRVCYECRDEWEEFSHVGMARWFSPALETYCVQAADRVFCVSPNLVDKMKVISGRSDDIRLSPNATTDDFIAMAAQSEPRRRRSEPAVVGYFGHLTPSWFDWDAYVSAAESLPHLEFELIGFDLPDIALPRNVKYFGSKSHAEIIEISSRWMVGLIPFKASALSLAVDPIKFYEYVALGLNVVTTRMGSLQDGPNVFIYREFGLKRAIERAVDAFDAGEAFRSAAARDVPTWRGRLNTMVNDMWADGHE